MNEEGERKRRHLIAGFLTLISAILLLFSGTWSLRHSLTLSTINIMLGFLAFIAIVLLFLNNNSGGYLALILSLFGIMINAAILPTVENLMGLLGVIHLFVGGAIGSTMGTARDLIDEGTSQDEEFFALMQDYVQCCRSIAAMKEVIGLKSYLTHDPSSIEEDLNKLSLDPGHWMVHYKYRDVNFRTTDGTLITFGDEMHPGQEAERLRLRAKNLYEKHASLQRLEEIEYAH